MKKKPSHAELMAFLYGELEGESHETVATYLNTDPVLAAELSEIKEARKALQIVPEMKVEPPMVFATKQMAKAPMRIWWRSLVGVAAAITLLLFTASVAKVQLGYDASGWYFSLGEFQSEVKTPAMDSMNLAFQQSLNAHEDSLFGRMDMQALEWERKLKAVTDRIPKKSNQQLDERHLVQFAENLRAENYTLADQMLNLIREEQSAFVQDAMTQMANYLREQRQQDLIQIEQALLQLQMRDQETGIVLSQVVGILQTEE